MKATNTTTLKKAMPNDLSALQTICREAYAQVFASHWTGNGLEIYLEQEFNTARLEQELTDEAYDYFFIIHNEKEVGFLKLKHQSAVELSEEDNCELEKIYILPKYGGKGIGKKAMTKIIDYVKRKGKKMFFLCVIDTNENAIAFYQKLGFQFHSTTRLEVPLFKEELRGMHRMLLLL